jgi:hypothetical protein
MASLDNFHTHQGGIFARPHRHYPSYEERMRMIQTGVQSSQSSMWDLANVTPIAPVQPHDPGNRAPNASVDPQYVERVSVRAMKDHFVPLRPHTQRLLGDTAEGVLLYHKHFSPVEHMRNLWSRFRAPVKTHSRYHPFQVR